MPEKLGGRRAEAVAPQGPFPNSDRVPPTANRPRDELRSFGRTLEDLAPAEKRPTRPGGVLAPLIWVAVTLNALGAFVGWLLVGPATVH
jgi:hypothetical protein